jgi:predicted RNA-binding protein with PUA-like domain
MAQRWLVKTEPSTYSFGQLQRDKVTVWDGVKNPLALKHLANIRKGDRIFIYHTGDEKAVVGTARATSDPYPDSRQRNPRFLVIDLAADRPLARPVTLAEIKQNAKLKRLDLVRLPRLSVMPVAGDEWSEIERTANE